MTVEPATECPDDEHDWKYVRDWAGDPDVINGAYDINYKTCRICGKEGEWDGDTSGDFDDY